MMLRTGRIVLAKSLGDTRSKRRILVKYGNTSVACCTSLASASKTTLNEGSKLKDVRSELYQAQDVSSLMQMSISENSTFKAYQAIHVLGKWMDENKINSSEDILNNEDFKRLLEIIESNPENPAVVLKGLKDLFKFGIATNAGIVQMMELVLLKAVSKRMVVFPRSFLGSEVFLNVRKVHIQLLLSIMVFHVKYQDTELQKKVLKETIDIVESRWKEIRNAKGIQIIYTHHKLFSAGLLQKMDDRTIEFAIDMSYSELCGIFCTLGTIKRRATPVLRSLSFYIIKKEHKLPPKQLSNLLFALNDLNFHNLLLLEKIGEDLIPQVPNIENPVIIGGVLYCIGQMRWRQTSLIDVLLVWIEKNLPVCRINDLVSMIITLGCVAYSPANVDSMFSDIIPRLTTALKNEEVIWLNVVWSLVLMGKATNSLVSSVLDSSFVDKVIGGSHHFRMGTKLKFLNINSFARLSMPSYEGPYLDLSNFKDIIITQSRNELMLTKHIQSLLHNFLPPPKYIIESVQTSMGILVPSEFAIDKNGKPIPIIDYTNNFGESKTSKDLPEGASRIAMFTLDYDDFTIGSKELTGVNQLAVKLIDKVGYKVIHIPHYEYDTRRKTINNIQYLESKIKEIACVS